VLAAQLGLGRAMDDAFEVDAPPLVAVTAVYLLADSDALRCAPGSHRARGAGAAPAAPVAAHSGSCVLLDRRLACTLVAPLRAVFVSYAPRWLRPSGPMWVEPALAAGPAGPGGCPVLRQLLGWHSSCSGLWGGNLEDVPLLAWLAHHGLPPGEGAKVEPVRAPLPPPPLPPARAAPQPRAEAGAGRRRCRQTSARWDCWRATTAMPPPRAPPRRPRGCDRARFGINVRLF
jgi:hypothetical protein